MKYWEIKRDTFREICEILRNKTRYILWNQRWNMIHFMWNNLLDIYMKWKYFMFFSTHFTYFTPGPNVSIIAHISQYCTLYFTAPSLQMQSEPLALHPIMLNLNRTHEFKDVLVGPKALGIRLLLFFFLSFWIRLTFWITVLPRNFNFEIGFKLPPCHVPVALDPSLCNLKWVPSPNR